MNIEQARAFVKKLSEYVEDVDSHHKVAVEERLVFKLYNPVTDEYEDLDLFEDDTYCFDGFELSQLMGCRCPVSVQLVFKTVV